MINKRGEVFGLASRLLKPDTSQQCYFTALTSQVDLFSVDIENFKQTASDVELSSIYHYFSEKNSDKPQFHLRGLSADFLLKEFLKTDDGLLIRPLSPVKSPNNQRLSQKRQNKQSFSSYLMQP